MYKIEFDVYGYCGALGDNDYKCSSKKKKTLEGAKKNFYAKLEKKFGDSKYYKELVSRAELVIEWGCLSEDNPTTSNSSNEIVTEAVLKVS